MSMELTATLRIRIDDEGYPVVQLIAGSNLIGGGKAKIKLEDMATKTLTPMESVVVTNLFEMNQRGIIDNLRFDHDIHTLNVVTEDPIPDSENMEIIKSRFPINITFTSLSKEQSKQ